MGALFTKHLYLFQCIVKRDVNVLASRKVISVYHYSYTTGFN